MKKINIILSSLLMLAGCRQETEMPVTISGSGKNAYGQYLTRDNKGHVVLSWLEEAEKDKDMMCFAVSEDGKNFGEPVKVTATLGTEAAHGECPPKIAYRNDGSIYVLFALKKPTENNQWAGNIYYTFSKDKGLNWSSPVSLDRDTNPDLSRAFFDVAMLGDGELAAIWLKGKDNKDTNSLGSAVYFAKTNGGSEFGAPLKIQDNTCECCRTDLFVDRNKLIHVTFRGVTCEQKRDMVHCISSDNGDSFSNASTISNDNWIVNGCPHVGPDVAEANGLLKFVWFTMGGKGGIYGCSSADNGKTFSRRETLVNSERASHPQVLCAANGKTIYVWDENFKEGEKFIQKIGVRIDQSGSSTIKYIDAADHVFHPLVLLADEEHAIVTYTKKEKNKEQVVYRKIKI